MDEAALRRLLTGRNSGVARSLARKAVATETAAKQIATSEGLVDTGRYRSSIGWRLGEDGQGLFAEIGSRVGYAGILERGSRPHVIVARNKKALWWKSAQHPVRLVRHPGTKAYRVLERALRIGVRA
jgi:hypothetical protein